MAPFPLPSSPRHPSHLRFLCLSPLASTTTLLVALTNSFGGIPAYASPSVSPIFPQEHRPRKYLSRYPRISANILRDIVSWTFAPITGLPSPCPCPSPLLTFRFSTPAARIDRQRRRTHKRLYTIFILSQQDTLG